MKTTTKMLALYSCGFLSYEQGTDRETGNEVQFIKGTFKFHRVGRIGF